MEKAFYPRNDTVNATISNLLPRDGTEDILSDQSGDPVYLQRSSVLDGTDVRGFGYVNGHPYKWRAEIESGIKSIAIVPDRFFSVYGKSYPIKRQQTVGINQPSESFKYEIIYLRGYDKYDDEPPRAKIIYHKQAEENVPHEYTCEEDKIALKYLDDFEHFPFLKIRVCYDGSIQAFLGTSSPSWTDQYVRYEDIENWDSTMPLGMNAWIEIPQIDVSQFRGIDLWLRFDSINALSYYLITKYEENIFKIGPKDIDSPLGYDSWYMMTIEKTGRTLKGTIDAPDGATTEEKTLSVWTKTGEGDWQKGSAVVASISLNNMYVKSGRYWYNADQTTDEQAFLYALKRMQGNEDFLVFSTAGSQSGSVISTGYDVNELIEKGYEVDLDAVSPGVSIEKVDRKNINVNRIVGNDYDLIDSAWTSDTSGCVPCCKKANVSRALWAYVNPKTMQPYDDDYWFHQGEVYYKKSLTLSTKEAPVKAQRIYVNAGEFPGMYKIVGETYIRSRDTGEDERVQLSFPLCKIKSNQTLTLQADGDPTTFNLEVEVATPENNIPMEITFYEVEKDVKKGCCGSIVEKDGSTRISAK